MFFCKKKESLFWKMLMFCINEKITTLIHWKLSWHWLAGGGGGGVKAFTNFGYFIWLPPWLSSSSIFHIQDLGFCHLWRNMQKPYCLPHRCFSFSFKLCKFIWKTWAYRCAEVEQLAVHESTCPPIAEVMGGPRGSNSFPWQKEQLVICRLQNTLNCSGCCYYRS